MNDEFLERLKSDWIRQPVDIEAVARRMRRWRWAPQLILVGEALGVVFGLAVGLYFLRLAGARHDFILAISGVALIVAPPIGLILSALARRPAIRWHDETPEGVLAYALTRNRATAAAVTIARWSLLVLVGLVVLFWLCVAAGAAASTVRLGVISGGLLAMSALIWIWLGWRSRRLRAEREIYEQLLDDYQGVSSI